MEKFKDYLQEAKAMWAIYKTDEDGRRRGDPMDFSNAKTAKEAIDEYFAKNKGMERHGFIRAEKVKEKQLRKDAASFETSKRAQMKGVKAFRESVKKISHNQMVKAITNNTDSAEHELNLYMKYINNVNNVNMTIGEMVLDLYHLGDGE
jgi:arginyl-tRNA--protein-N-Asp/Glu arginylyltransferase